MSTSINGTSGSIDPATRHLQTVFRALSGTWKLDRRLESSNASEPSGRCQGQAVFAARPPSHLPGNAATNEMVYHENGEFEMTSVAAQSGGFSKFPFSRKYIWRLDADLANRGNRMSGVSIWFVKPGTDEVDYLFHELSIPTIDESTCLVVQGDHLCVKDLYDSEYIFYLRPTNQSASGGQEGVAVIEWKMKHVVVGPQKHQRIETIFKR